MLKCEENCRKSTRNKKSNCGYNSFVLKKSKMEVILWLKITVMWKKV